MMTMMTTTIRLKAFLITVLTLTFLYSNAQESQFKEFAEEHNDRAFCFYPSTLRMLNIDNNPEFDQVVNGVEKLLIYKLDSISIADKLYVDMTDSFKSLQFEEVISIMGGGNTTSVLVSPQGVQNQFVGVIVSDDISVVFYLKGDIGWAKIPKILDSFNDENFINVMDLKF